MSSQPHAPGETNPDPEAEAEPAAPAVDYTAGQSVREAAEELKNITYGLPTGRLKCVCDDVSWWTREGGDRCWICDKQGTEDVEGWWVHGHAAAMMLDSGGGDR